MLFLDNAPLVWGLIASLYIGNVMLLILNLPLVGVWARLLSVPKPQLYAGILVFATIGVFSMRQSWFDLLLMYVIGVAGVIMRRFDFPVAPVIIGMILGPMSEKQLRNALAIAQGDWLVFFKQPIAATIMGLTFLVLFVPIFLRRRGVRLSEDD